MAVRRPSAARLQAVRGLAYSAAFLGVICQCHGFGVPATELPPKPQDRRTSRRHAAEGSLTATHTHSVVRSALFCLEIAMEQGGSHVYTKALMAYAFTLAGKEEKHRALLDSLDKEAVKEDGSVHWQRPGKQPEADLPFYHPRAPSAEVEMTSYLLLAYLPTRPAPSQEDLSLAAQIAKWISKQQNPNGGFSSTQDTVVALQALSRYGASTYTKSGGASTVTLQSTGNFQTQFQVDHTNRLLLQRMALAEVPGDYSMGVTGEGCVYVQTSLRYNVLPKPEEEPFALEVHTVPEMCESPQVHRTFSIAINISYTGKRPVSNMVIVDVKMLSGFIPVKSSVRKLEGHHHIHRTELSTNHVLLYMEQVSNVTQSFSFAVEQDFPVQSLKPAVVKVYDYYETDEFAIAEYSAPCSKARNPAPRELFPAGTDRPGNVLGGRKEAAAGAAGTRAAERLKPSAGRGCRVSGGAGQAGA
ncbi:alpha-2-macroglobulin-like [Emys orbicularis]|uniref:alpha-2-macroglobulin-like n=1 Tax=Emys orbicularis TaxID=82168 RepID=UPI0031FD3662